MSKSDDSWKYGITKWQGYVVRALEDIDSELKDAKRERAELRNLITEAISSFNDKDNKTNSRINHLYVKVATLGVSVGTLAGFIPKILEVLTGG